MPDNRRVIYWDSCAFLSYVNEEPGKVQELEALLASSHRSGDTQIYTSVLSRVEVAFAASEQLNRQLSQQEEQRITDLWADPDRVISVETHDAVVEMARDLIRRDIPLGRVLKPYDAVHLATAQWLSSSGIQVDEFHTYDGRLLRYQGIVGFTICEPHTNRPMLL